MTTTDQHQLPRLRVAAPPVSRQALRTWWGGECGYREVLLLAWPLFLSQASSTILQFTDRVFLTWFSTEGMAAAGPAGMLAFTLQALFLGLTGYAATFVAQYSGAGRPRQAVAVVWQALYVALLASLITLCLLPLGNMIFRAAGHTAAIQAMERAYFSVFIYGSFAFIGSSALLAYFIGRGETRLVLWVNLAGVAVNIVLDYLLIFGIGPFPQLGVTGAAVASVIAQVVILLLAGGFFWRAARREAADAWRLHFPLFRRLLRFGSASGIQFALDMIGWTAFLLIIGGLGTTELGASNLAFQINSLAFFPMIGVAMATSTLVGQSLGRNRPELADRAVWSSIHIALCFTLVIGMLFLFAPGWLMAPFDAEADLTTYASVREMTIVMLRFVAAYCLFDVGNVIFSSALKGAGDTLFVMFLSTSICAALMLAPTVFWCVRPGGPGIWGAWSFLTLTVCVLSLAFLARYLRGHWRTMRVIEHHEPLDPDAV